MKNSLQLPMPKKLLTNNKNSADTAFSTVSALYFYPSNFSAFKTLTGYIPADKLSAY